MRLSQTADELSSPWDSYHSDRLIDLYHKGTDLSGQEHFLTREKKGGICPACYSFDRDWQHGLAPVSRRHMHRLLHCYPLINFWHTLQHEMLTGKLLCNAGCNIQKLCQWELKYTLKQLCWNNVCSVHVCLCTHACVQRGHILVFIVSSS